MSEPLPGLWDDQEWLPGWQEWTVGELTLHIKDLLELDPELQDVWLVGEVSNLTRASSGHLYFTLKDATAAIGCVMWRTDAARLGKKPEHGVEVRVHGRISVYAPRGNYQLIVDQMQPVGLGDLHARFEQLRDRLRAEGLFEAERKKPLPFPPRVVGVVTSPQAAALRDVLNVLSRRYPLVQVLLAPTLVQGDQAPPQIVAALQALDSREEVDLILLVRGGGSLEELWAFNDERVARAIAACRHPVVSGVGHETDFTIADFVADLRAPTPSAAAELVVPDQIELRQRVGDWAATLAAWTERRLDGARDELEQWAGRLQRQSPRARIDAYRQQADDAIRRSGRALRSALALRRSNLAGMQSKLEALGPQATLDRGYAIVMNRETRTVIAGVGQVAAGDALTIRVRDGAFHAVAKRDPCRDDQETEP